MSGSNPIPGFVAVTQPGSNEVYFRELARGTGSHFFVDSNNGSNSNSGLSPGQPVATLAYAIGLCTANAGDIIWLMPGHADTVSAAAGIVCDIAGITVIGIGEGSLRPSITFDTANTADMDIDAAGVTFKNVLFLAGFADLAAPIDVNADDFTLDGCFFREAAVNQNALVWIQDAAAGGSDRITVKNCHCIDKDAANTHFINFAGTGDGHVVANNVLIGDWGTACIGGAGVVTNATIIGNRISNAATDNDSCINFAATATGICMNNLACGGAAQANGITATAMAIAENYYGVVSEDLSAILEPIAT